MKSSYFQSNANALNQHVWSFVELCEGAGWQVRSQGTGGFLIGNRRVAVCQG